MSTLFVYITAKNPEEASNIGRMLVEKRLCACVNIFPTMHSIYRWQGKVTEDKESVLIAKTREENLEALIAAVKASHSYEVPCIVSWPLAKGYQPYLQWIKEQS